MNRWALLSLDVSSSATGYAVLRPDGTAADFGVWKPRAALPSLARIDETVELVLAFATGLGPESVVMEWSAGKVHGAIAAKRRTSGLAVLGQAQGAVRQALAGAGFEVATVGESEWTNRRPKAERADLIALLFPAYAEFRAAGKDPGLDAADALGLANYYRGKLLEAACVARAAAAGSGKGVRIPAVHVGRTRKRKGKEVE